MLQKIQRFWPAAVAVLLFFSLIAEAGAAREGVKTGLSLAFNLAIPALFPFFIAGALLSDTGVTSALGRVCARLMHRVYGLPGEAAGALVLGFTGGYPVGVQAAADLYRGGYLTRPQTERLLGFCNNTGPAFIVGICGAGVFGSVQTGVILYIIHVFSALLCGLFLASGKQELSRSVPPTKTAPTRRFSAALVAACERAAQTSIKVAAFILLFSVFAALLEASDVLYVCADALAPVCRVLGIPEDAAWPLVYGALELTRGLAVLPEAGLPLRHAMPVASTLLAFGGLSVWCQSLSLAAENELLLGECLRGKLLHAALAGALTVVWCTLRPEVQTVFAAADAAVFLPLPLRLVPIVTILFTFTYRKRRRNRI